jgi:FSR family fosmidomycin resistance protein-like MFS transporter
MASSLIGVILLSIAADFHTILVAAALVGLGSSVFHPEASRIARLTSGGRHGFAQSLFQVGGNAGTALGPLLAAFIVVPRGQGSLAWFSIVAVAAMIVLTLIGFWYCAQLGRASVKSRPVLEHTVSRRKVVVSLVILLALVFSKNFYLVSLTSFYTFYLIDTFEVSVQAAQLYLFVFLGAVAVAVGTVDGGPLGDRIGFKAVIWDGSSASFPSRWRCRMCNTSGLSGSKADGQN